MLKNFLILIFAGFLFLYSLKPALSESELVIVNIKKHVYHRQNCQLAQSCYNQCLETTLERARKIYSAIPCKSCHKAQKKPKKKHRKKHKKKSRKS